MFSLLKIDNILNILIKVSVITLDNKINRVIV